MNDSPSKPIVPNVVLTFDDGFSEHHTLAAPVLEKYGFRGIFNICPDAIDTKKDFESGHTFLTWDQVRDLMKRGHEITNHSLTHADLRILAEKGDLETLRRELTVSRDRIREETGRAPRWLCHPYVQFNDVVNEEIRKAGMLPMSGFRRNFGEGTVPFTETGVGAYIRECIARGEKFIDILTHGVTAEGRGYKPFAKIEIFEEHLKELRALADAGTIRVLDHYELD